MKQREYPTRIKQVLKKTKNVPYVVMIYDSAPDGKTVFDKEALNLFLKHTDTGMAAAEYSQPESCTCGYLFTPLGWCPNKINVSAGSLEAIIRDVF